MSHHIIIAGVPRSGTSMTARLVKEWGARAGEDQQFDEADAFNARGYWEYKPLKRFHDDLLRACNASMIDPPSEAQLQALSHDPAWRHRALGLLKEMGDEQVWFWKQPLLSFLLPFWQHIWDDPVYIICIRNPLSGALSQKHMFESRILRRDTPIDNFPLSGALLLWQHYILSILSNTNTSTKKIFLGYEQTLADYEQTCKRLHDFLNISFETEGNLDAMLDVVRPELQHHVDSQNVFFQLDTATTEQKNLYRFLLEKIHDPDAPFLPERFTMPSDWKDILHQLQSWYAQFLPSPA